ncbi:DUF899 domain-containing protein [Streptomyces tsukubensis]|uniref:DUF899 domain-containing protein n=1 Tax=Streptomyces tsukubensis TaxID=83656 RepID=A0A1V4A3Z5_9ACTN|nr:DUF899 domain-containing protein [Streptomyces tsukubensis]OON74688.1 hypothetical protein B1H18_24605 [Streptomyces tsukubensis]QFR93040.1 DUF899 domain-containing protein [Streptomyces tsukubensis]
MGLPEVVTREEWLRAREELLAKEKAATRARDELNAERRRLPMVAVDKDYLFVGPDGKAGLADLFEGRDQLVVHHFMFQPEWEAGCRSCSAFLDQIGNLAHLRARGTAFAAVSRAPYTKILPFKARMGWSVPWYSSYESDFNQDFHVTLAPSAGPVVHSYRTAREHAEHGDPALLTTEGPFDLPGVSCFLRDDGGRIFHTYSAFARGLDGLGSTTSLLDLTALGRQEEWEEPKGRASALGAPAGSVKVRYHDEYVD